MNSRNMCGWQQEREENPQVVWGVGQPNHGATVELLLGVARGAENVPKHWRLRGEQPLVHLEAGVLRDEDDIPVLEPEMRVTGEVGEGGVVRRSRPVAIAGPFLDFGRR